MFRSTEYDSPLGRLTLASDGQAICGLWIEGQKYHGAGLPEQPEPGSDDALDALAAWLDAYFAGERPDAGSLPLAPRGSDFRQAVWEILRQIPYGETTTYGEIAQQLKAQGGSASALAVGGAVGHNPISIVIPCHRVVGADGSLTGYAGGIGRKMQLLQLEGVDTSRLHAPRKGTAL